jgi:DNA-binding transcriptional ArsR family regulator
MSTNLPHPDIDQITLPAVLTALGDETRLAIVGYLARNDEQAMNCSRFSDLGSKTGLSYHLAKLREAGVISVRPEGTRRFVTLRRADLDQRFPGFLDIIIANAIDLPMPSVVTKPSPAASAEATVAGADSASH